jgi:hypothetical protein
MAVEVNTALDKEQPLSTSSPLSHRNNMDVCAFRIEPFTSWHMHSGEHDCCPIGARHCRKLSEKPGTKSNDSRIGWEFIWYLVQCRFHGNSGAQGIWSRSDDADGRLL